MRTDVKDTRRFETHAEWCQHLWVVGSLSETHRGCRGRAKCASSIRYSVDEARRSPRYLAIMAGVEK